MNYRFVFSLAGALLKYQALAMILPLLISFYYKDTNGGVAFLMSMAVTYTVGVALVALKPKSPRFDTRECFAGIAVVWIVLSVFGALPFYASGYFKNFIDALFESVAAITTTGTTVQPLMEVLPRGILFWRNFMQWVGGIGILIFILAIIPHMGASALQLLRAESAGPSPEKLVPKIKETAKITYMIYFFMTILLIILLLLSGLPLYDSTMHALGTAATGGSSNRNLSVGAYNNAYAELIIAVFMFLFGVNFSLYYQLIKKDYKAFKNEEFLVYLVLTLVCIITVGINTREIYGGFSESLRYASFQVSSMISSTCYSTTDYNYWPTLSRSVLVFLAFIGGCAGSTSGGLKISRVVIMIKAARMELKKIVKPRVVNTAKFNGKRIENELITLVFLYFFLYISIIAVATILVSFDNHDLVSTFTAVLGAMSSVGSGFEMVGPTGNFSSFSSFSKIVLSLCMIIGRLEIFPVMILFNPMMWKKGAII